MKNKVWLFGILVFFTLIFSGVAAKAELLYGNLTEQESWYVPEFFNDAEAAYGAIKNIQNSFVDWDGNIVRQIDLDNYGLRLFCVWEWTDNRGVSHRDEELTIVPFDRVRTMHLLFYPKLNRDNKYGVRIDLADGNPVNFRTVDAAAAKRLANAIATLVLASGNKLYPMAGISVITDKKEEAKIRRKLKWKEEYGAAIEGVVPESPANVAGLKANDIILEINGVDVKDGGQCLRLLRETAEKNCSAMVALKVFSGGETMERRFQLVDPNKGWTGKPQRTDKGNTSRPAFGVSVRPVNADDQKTLGLPSTEGLLVTEVKKDSLAERSGLRVDDVLLAVNGVAIKNGGQLKEVLAAGEIKSVKVFRGGKEVLLETAEVF